MAIRDWPANERPREKLLERGAESLTPTKLPALAMPGVIGAASASAVVGYYEFDFRHD